MGRVIRFFLDERNYQSSTWRVIVFYLVLVGIHCLMGFWMKGPIYVADEPGYLGNARYLVGKGVMPNMVGCLFYHAGYSLIISPAFYLFSDPQKVYLTVLVINSFLISSLFLFLYYCLKKIFFFDAKNSLLASFITCLYPAFFINSNIAVAENAMIPFFILPMIFLYLMIKHKSIGFGVLFGFTVSFLYTIHPRALILLPMAGLYLMALILLRFLPIKVGVVSVATLLCNYLITTELHRNLQMLGWSGGGTPPISKIIGILQGFDKVVQAMIVMIGQLWYIAVATYSLWILGLLIVAFKIWEHRSSLKQEEPVSPFIHTLTFYILSCGGIFFTSVMFLFHLWLGGDVLIYGRYNESFIAFGMAVALGVLLENRHNEKIQNSLGPITLFFLCGLSLITLGIGVRILKHQALSGGIHWLGVFPVLGAIQFKLQLSFFIGILVCSLYALGMILILWRAFKIKRKVGMMVLCSLFLMFGLVEYVYLFLPVAKKIEGLTLPKVIRSIPEVHTLSFDLAFRRRAELYRYQYFLPDTRFVFFNSSKNEFPKSEYFISSRFSQESPKIGAQVVALEKEGDLALWVKKRDVEIR